MESLSWSYPKLPWFPVCTVILMVINNGLSLQTLVCSSSASSAPLECTNQQWVRIVSETYAPEIDLNGTSCGQNITECNSYFYDTGMLVNCNGPAWRGGVACREEVSVDAARGTTACLRDVEHVATDVQFDCVDESTVLKLCDANATVTSGALYLASPGYPQAIPEGQMCTCSVKGSNLKMDAVEINVKSKLPWGDDANSSSVYRSVVSVTSGSNVLWRSSDCAACTSISLMNTNLFLSDESIRYQDVVVTYSDYGLPDQKVWIKVSEFGSNLSITCNSSQLPPDKILTTTTSATTATTPPSTSPTIITSSVAAEITANTTSPTTVTSSVAAEITANTTSPRTITSSVAAEITANTASTASTTTTSTLETAASTITSTSNTATSQNNLSGATEDSGSTAAPINGTPIADTRSGEPDKDPNGPIVLIVVLVVLLSVTAVAAVILGILIYRKRHTIKVGGCTGLSSPCKRLLCQEKPKKSPKYTDLDSVDGKTQQRPHRVEMTTHL